MKPSKTLYLGLTVFLSACQQEQQPFLPQYDGIDLFIENGQVFDGLGNAPFNADIAVVGAVSYTHLTLPTNREV